jgi:hypothetical protein
MPPRRGGNAARVLVIVILLALVIGFVVISFSGLPAAS